MSDPQNEIEKIDYDFFVSCLVKNPAELVQEYTALKANLDHMAMGVVGEAGELVDAIKRHTKYNKPLDFENVIEELGDIEFYLEGLRQALSIDREETLRANKHKLAKRYASLHYSNEAAIARADKEGE